jgi:hypothetical protein
MARKHTSDVQMFNAQLERFRRVSGGARIGMRLLRRESLDELKTLSDGSKGPKGKARLRALRAAGHPYGRRVSGDPTTGKRGIVKNRKGRRVGQFPQLPIGMISGALDRSRFATINENDLSDYKLTVGFNRKAGPSINVVLPAGTKKMVGRGLMLPNERGEFGARMKRARRAFSEAFFKPLTKP